jgi:hypothetical protein
MPPVYFHPDGTPSRNPTSLYEAKEARKQQYDDGALCPLCEKRNEIIPGHTCSIKYTKTRGCIHCALLQALDFYNRATGAGREPPPLVDLTDDAAAAFEMFHYDKPAPLNLQEATAQGLDVWVHPDPCHKAGHIGVRTGANACWFCRRDALRKKDPARAEAHASKQTWYTPTMACEKCGKTADRNTRSNECRGCHPLPSDAISPRKAAMLAGRKWYTPDKACAYCGQCAPKRVNNGACKGCVQPDATAVTIRDAPDLVLSKADALALGLTAYRTGEPCENGHAAYRHTATDQCIPCS